MGGLVWAPSEVALDLGKHSNMFRPPQAMTQENIDELIARFATTARRAQEAGFDGVQIHAAHGYLISQFLSPHTNQRSDGWGGAIAGRARLLIAVVRAVRQVVQPGFAVAVKLNSADFQAGGFSHEDAIALRAWSDDGFDGSLPPNALGEQLLVTPGCRGGVLVQKFAPAAAAGAPPLALSRREVFEVAMARGICGSRGTLTHRLVRENMRRKEALAQLRESGATVLRL